MNWLRKIRVFIWGEYKSTAEEEHLLRKIDWFVLSFCCLMYFTNYLDRANLSNAFVSGMREDLQMYGRELNIANTLFTVGYTVGMIPNNLALQVFKPRYYFPFCTMAWGLLTLGTYAVTTYKQIYAIRFFQGFFEASTFVGTHFILGSWYSGKELAKRTAIFTSSGLIGTLFSGFLQSAVFKGLSGKGGLAGWRWLFIIDAIITFPVALYGFIFFPDTPATTQAFYFDEKERQMSVMRLPPRPDTKLDWTVVKRVLGRWHFYMFGLLWGIAGEVESPPANNLFGQYLKASGWSVIESNRYPMGVSGVGVVATVVAASYVDQTGKHWHVGVAAGLVGIVSTVLVLVNRTPTVFAGYYLCGCVYMVQAAFFAWANVVTANDKEERSVVLASMNMISNATNAWWMVVFYGADTAPEFRLGMWAMLAVSIALIGWVSLVRWLQLREDKRVDLHGSGDESTSTDCGDHEEYGSKATRLDSLPPAVRCRSRDVSAF
ncbi:major facilitator superfamily domain-containing protein [Yarrowia lipolytica]|jgi:ACS family pantothenate transporter-like MFS transporter|uniref:YALI0F06842p n=2 Tax=Yarrowia lipolytica TaxID=4952 RepID=Q6C2L4_YARLI|nr:YALI0F06842p [Yarrowia lipolytica CLIB122]AOW06780.1 hypothetical protein YALI1_F10122g [Yarrowia lipolytica]KAB8284880.1 major facilitator superfamily domain-containing protein [Yarrowia lipolytica]KAE8174706.1 major facilitator superfamily domain-containing protein [Yarrowia lipolytica]KAJ8056015.1 major facilitator superfamily domain-containing protein [Yarrowia lipolytica]QNQ00592.1 Pantothenate transporter liz1 [Yarrowia lipolytica]|eukprot:XP_505098.1 YALI0F06842p [Yarrowia lipolytica CLIB122]